MTGAELALDTNQAIAVLNGTGDIHTFIEQFDHIYLPAPVIGELLYGARNSARKTENVARIQQLVAQSTPLDVTAETADFYAEIRCHLKEQGRPIPENDIWIAAVCIQHSIPLASSDLHFAHITNLKLMAR